MPPLAHPEPLIPEHQRLRADPLDSACSSSASSSSFFGKLWPNRRKFAPSGNNASVISYHETCDSSCKQSANSFRLRKGDNDANGWSMRFPTWILPAHEQGHSSSICIVEQNNAPSNKSEEDNSDPGTQVHSMHCKDLNAQSFPVRESGMRPVVESFKEVVINKQMDDNAESSLLCGNVHDLGERTTGNDNASSISDDGDRRVCSEHALPKRAASFKAGETMSVCGLKKLRLSTLCELQRVVVALQRGSLEERWLAADEVLDLCKDDPIARVTLGVQLKAIPPLIFILHSAHPKHQRTALLALLNLAVGNDVNKAAIVKEKALQRMVVLLQSMHAEVQAAVVTLFLNLSALDANKAEIGASGSIPLLVSLMHKEHTRKDALRALYNISIHAAGIDIGRHSLIEHKELAYAVLIDVIQWMEMPKCQERAVYVLMMIAHHSPTQREAMAAAGVIPALVELSLLGSVLAQKRATRTLDSFRRAKAFSGPQQRQCTQADMVCANGSQSMTRALSEKKVVDGLVRQSLHRTMQRITRRANLSKVVGDSIPSTVVSFRRPLDRRSSSCSLPF
ncbi:hypothetical protein GOP47_0020593 [Adiantum capillus-veneris]|uniref:Uncharacterized protein n=1 Tax=Adiantum capillus-veneris TaxID=13818 RepID=A0A9D4Z681_ADICA|nr:hypothetical protein GOP47_0020593 [Adiantum capillus-veneris]